MNFWEELDKIEDLNGTNEKEDYIISLIKTFPEAEGFFRMACGDIVYNLAEKSFHNAFNNSNMEYEHVSNWLYTIAFEPTNITGGYKWEDMEQFAELMTISSGNEQLTHIFNFFRQLDNKHRKWFCRALLHDLRCGVKRKTVNNALKALDKPIIKKFALMLADKIKTGINDKEAVLKKIEFPAARETKYDGIRMQAEIFQDNQNYTHCILTSRRGKIRTEDYPEIANALKMHFEGQNLILDGEIISSSFQELTRKESTAKKQYVVFDLLNDEKLAYKYRWSNLQMLINSIHSDFIILPEHDEVNNYEDLLEDFDKAVERGDEGIMIKFLDAPYERDTRKHMFKFKKVYTADLKITGFNYGEGKRAGKVGSLCLETSDGKIKVDVGSGFTDEICEELTNQMIKASLGSKVVHEDNTITDLKPDFIGKICEISYNELTETGSIRFPRFKCIREDKENADAAEDLETR